MHGVAHMSVPAVLGAANHGSASCITVPAARVQPACPTLPSPAWHLQAGLASVYPCSAPSTQQLLVFGVFLKP